MIFLIIILGVLHGLFLLPVLLSLFGPGACSDPNKFNKSGVMSPAGATLSETFTYHTQLSSTKERGSRTKESSLRRLVLSGEIKKGKLHRGTFNDSTVESITDNGSSPFSKTMQDLKIYELEDSRNSSSENLLEAGSKDDHNQLHNRTGGHGRGDMLPYYKFAHVKRTAYLPDSRNEHFWTAPKLDIFAREEIDESGPDDTEYFDGEEEEAQARSSSDSTFEDVDLKQD